MTIFLTILAIYATVLLPTLVVLLRRAPLGWEDQAGFHLGDPPPAAPPRNLPQTR